MDDYVIFSNYLDYLKICKNKISAYKIWFNSGIIYDYCFPILLSIMYSWFDWFDFDFFTFHKIRI